MAHQTDVETGCLQAHPSQQVTGPAGWPPALPSSPSAAAAAAGSAGPACLPAENRKSLAVSATPRCTRLHCSHGPQLTTDNPCRNNKGSDRALHSNTHHAGRLRKQAHKLCCVPCSMIALSFQDFSSESQAKKSLFCLESPISLGGLSMTCVAGIRALEDGGGTSVLSWQNPILCFSMRSSCERSTTPCRSNGTSAHIVCTLPWP